MKIYAAHDSTNKSSAKKGKKLVSQTISLYDRVIAYQASNFSIKGMQKNSFKFEYHLQLFILIFIVSGIFQSWWNLNWRGVEVKKILQVDFGKILLQILFLIF